MTRFAKAFLAAVAAFGCTWALSARAQEHSGPQVRLPSNPAQWINSPPLSMRLLRGKGVVLYFFEEG